MAGGGLEIKSVGGDTFKMYLGGPWANRGLAAAWRLRTERLQTWWTTASGITWTLTLTLTPAPQLLQLLSKSRPAPPRQPPSGCWIKQRSSGMYRGMLLLYP